MLPNGLRGNLLAEGLLSLGIFALGLALAWAASRLVAPLATRMTKRTASSLDDHIVWAIRLPLVTALIAHGALIGLGVTTFVDSWREQFNRMWVTLELALAFWVLQRVLASLLYWWAAQTATTTGGNWGRQASPVLRRMLTITVVSIGLLMILAQLDISISPLLAGLGIGGLAVALALQPTLSNFISGTYVLSDGAIRPGDFVELADGPRGRVTEVGWRTTKLVSPQNNLVTIPNSKLADSILTNYAQPSPAMSIFLTCKVSYNSDLARVERVCMEVMRQVQSARPEVTKDFEPMVLFNEFADSNINMWLILQAIDRGATFTVTHELIKALHARFKQEGIEINYPVRRLELPPEVSNFVSRPHSSN